MNNEELKAKIAMSKATAQDFALALGISRSCLSRWTKGQTPIAKKNVPNIEQVLEKFIANPPRYRIHQSGPRRRRMK